VLELSLAEARELYNLLSEIEVKLDNVTAKSNFTIYNVRQAIHILFEMVEILDHLGMGKTNPELIKALRETIYWVNMLRIAINIMLADPGVGTVLRTIGFVAGVAAYFMSGQRQVRT
jgi:hypothetical protein